MLEAVGQCQIWLHGREGCWRHGYDRKLSEGFDLGNADKGIAFHGNMCARPGDRAPDPLRPATVAALEMRAVSP